jgi:hypothetical protein
MVPLSERDAVTRRAKADAEMRAVYAFLFSEPFDFANEQAFPHANLLRAVAGGDAGSFRTEVASFQKRRTSEGSGWYENDSLIFLLLVGCERFQVEGEFLESILTARERNTNPVPKQVNAEFRALSRKDYGMESPFSFIKLVLLQLTGHPAISSDAARKVYQELTQGGFVAQLSPFLQLLALRAYDLVLFDRQPKPFENFDELVRALETYQEKASVRQAAKLLWALPYKWALGIISAATLAMSFFFGLGQQTSDSNHAGNSERQRPTTLRIVSHTDATISELPSVRALTRQIRSLKPAAEYWSAVALQTSPLQHAASKFSLEASTVEGRIVGAHGWLVHDTESGPSLTLLPVQQGATSARAFAEAAESKDYIIFVLIVKTAQPTELAQLADGITLRTLD